MAITTDSLVTVESGDVTYDTIGLSKTLDNYTVEEIAAFTFCGAYDDKVKFLVKGLGSGNDITMIGFTADYGAIPMGAVFVGGDYSQPEFSPGDTGAYNLEQGKLDYKVIWLQANSYDYVITENNCDNYKALTEFDINKYTVNIASISDGGTSGTMYFPDMSKLELYYTSDRGSLSSVDILVDAQPYIVFQKDTEFFMVHLFLFSQYTISKFTHINNSNAASNMMVFEDFSDTYKYGGGLAFNELYTDWAMENPVGLPHKISVTTNFVYVAETDTEGILATAEFGADNGLECRYGYSDAALMMQIFANAGLYFKYNSNYYKPVISGGWVLSYTDDLDTPSEIDEWERTAQHEITPTPPTPPGPYDDDWHGIDFGGASLGGAGAFAKLYYMTQTELANLRSWMNSNSVPEGFNPMAQIIGLSQFPVALSGGAPETIKFVNSAAIYGDGQNRVVDTGISATQAPGAPIPFNLGSVTITRRMLQRGEPYLDYSCGIELYLPLVGMFTLDTQAVMDRTIYAAMTLDPCNGTVAAYAWVEKGGQKLPVAYGSSTISVDLPVTAQQYSVSKGALAQANAQLGQSMLGGAFQAILAAGGAGAAAEQAGDATYLRAIQSGRSASRGAVRAAEKDTLAGAAGDILKYQASSNVVSGFMNWGRAMKEISYGNNTAIMGSFGGSFAQWSYPFTAYVKIVRPKFQKPSNYNHTQAVPCVEAKTVSSCTGLIQCIGVDVSSITNATSTERDAIAAALCNGVYAGGA
ncbi:MAG: hypothetical protein IKU15_05540 [Clostridia bacterium]|nr:hypothetical protein [Treponema sp.]MBR4890732.1 hypothetical protein [Clostridia bacterium]